MENPIKVDDLGVPLFQETPICPLIIPVVTNVARGADPKCLEGRQQQIEEDAGQQMVAVRVVWEYDLMTMSLHCSTLQQCVLQWTIPNL